MLVCYFYGMIKSKFIQLYLQLNKAELRQLKEWIYSPVHNKHEGVQQLFEYLFSRRTITAVTVKKERLFKAVFVEEKFEEGKLRVVVSYALKVLKEFVGYNYAVCNVAVHEKNIIQGLKEHQMEQLALQQVEKTSNRLAKGSTSNAQTSLQQYELEVERFELIGTQQRTIQTNLPQLFEHLSDFYIISMLKYACTAVTHSNLAIQEYQIPLLDAILEGAQEHKHPIVQLYYWAYQALVVPKDKTAFEKARQLFALHFQKLNSLERYEMLLILINYCIKRLNTDAEEYSRIAFDWYQWGLENDLLLQNGQLSKFAYKNIVALGLKLKEFEWVDAFIPKYAVYLPIAIQENYQHYNRSKSLFAQGAYKQALRLLIQVEYDDVFLNMGAKIMLLKIYYEEETVDALDSLLVSFQRFLQRKSILAYHKQVYQNIIFLTRKLMDLAPYDKVGREKLRLEIEATHPLAERDWLLHQVE